MFHQELIRVNIRFVSILPLMFAVLNFSAFAIVGEESGQLSIKVTPPKDFKSNDKINIVGNFNKWALTGPNAQELHNVNGSLSVEIPKSGEYLFFTFVKNKDWQLMPASELGKSKCTYMHKYDPSISTIHIDIPAWRGDAPLILPSHTLTGNIEKFADFEMPQLERKGDISVYLPPSYYTDKDKKYPVVYMLDGQNVFDEYTAYSDEWRVDELLEGLITREQLREIIVVAIPNGLRRRYEYNPWDFKDVGNKKGTGEGEKTIEFIKKTLKPSIDEKYRTLITKENTGLMGSSLGGLMALYAAIEHDEVFGFVGAFSVAMAFESMEGKNVLFDAIKRKNKIGTTKIYFDIGRMEYGNYDRIEKLEALLLSRGAKEHNIRVVKDDIGRHCELDWSKRLPEAIKWLLAV